MSAADNTAADDAALMLRLRNGDDLALNELMARWQQPMVGFVYRFTGNHADAVDLAQEVFVKVYQNRHRYREGGSFSSWIFAMAANLCRNHHRWQSRHPADLASSEAEMPDTHDPAPLPDDAAARKETALAVRDAVTTLPADLRLCVILSEYEGQSQAQIAVTLGCTPKAVETRLYRARQLLREKLGRLLGHQSAARSA